MKIRISILFIMVFGYCHSQTSKPEIVKKEIPAAKGIDIIGYHNANQTNNPSEKKIYIPKNYVYFNKKFYSQDTLNKIKNLDQYHIEIIPIPASVSKDIDGIIYVRKKE